MSLELIDYIIKILETQRQRALFEPASVVKRSIGYIQALCSSCHGLIMDERRGFYDWYFYLTRALFLCRCISSHGRTGVTMSYKT